MLERGHIISLVAFTWFVLAGSIAEADPIFGFVPETFCDLTMPGDTLPPGAGTQADTSKEKVDLVYPLEDRQGDHLTDSDDNPFLLDDPPSIEKNVEYDPETNRYIVTETMDGKPVRPPTYMTFDEYMQYESDQARREYYKERLESISLVEQPGLIPKIYVGGKKGNSKFGTIDIRPSGNIDVTFGGNVQNIDNPLLTQQARKQGGFDFDMNINMNVVGNIGDLLKVNMTYNTGATFDFENQIKLKYEGEEDDIVQLLEAGNVSFPLNTTLIQGTQSLFGAHAKLKFGRLTISTVYSQQKSKSQNLTVQDGAQTQTFEVYSDEYDENRHYFLSQFFRDQYDEALSNLPNINSLVQITRLEVWVTNTNGATQNVRDVVALQDLGEPVRIHNTNYTANAGQTEPNNGANDLYSKLISDPSGRTIDNITNYLTNTRNLRPVEDYEKVFARQLSPSEFTYNAQLGYISLNQQLYPDQVLGVAFEYTYNGKTYQVGEFSQDVPPDSTSASKVLYVKMLKATSVRPDLPIWDLMMKNVYSIGAYQVNSEDFYLDVYYQDPGGGLKRYIPDGSIEGKPLIRVLNMDNLNTQLDPQPDGVFDFMPGTTINPNNGRIIFTVVEPFGDDLRKQFDPSEQNTVAETYVYDQLYDSIKVIAQQFPQYNRYVLKGQYKSSVSSEISLGAFNVPEGSVKVTAGGQQLVEGQDFTVDYSLGRVKIINEGILSSGIPVNVSYENNALFGFQQKTLFGTRLDYWVSDKFSFGATYMHLRERPFTQKVNIGDDPISNGIWGLDFNYNTESQFLTWLVDKLPFYSTKETSTFSLSGEVARMKPGHSKAIGSEGVVYIDDFEGASSSYDLKFPDVNWKLASTPVDASNQLNNDLFPEATLFGDTSVPSRRWLYGMNRALLSWYFVDPVFQSPDILNRSNLGIDNVTKDDMSNHYTRQVIEQEVFPNKDNPNAFLQTLTTLNLSYFPDKRGPYNFECTANGIPGYTSGVNPDGTLKNPSSRWGGIMREIDNNNFEAANIEFIEMWVLDPFIYDSLSSGGEMFIDLGNVSEDVLKDSRFFYENGLPVPGSTNQLDITNWGRVPRVQPIVNAFDNQYRDEQDLGLDGWDDAQEKDFYSYFLNQVQGVVDPSVFQTLEADPASDNFVSEYDDVYNSNNLDATIIERYQRYNGTQGNTSAGPNLASNFNPDSEDLNGDNTINENEEYFQYRIELKPNMQVGENYITDIQESQVTLVNEKVETVKWYQFKVPIEEYEKRVGSIPDFKSIRFIRIFLTGFDDPVVVRFGRLELVRNQWRRYLQTLQTPGEYIPTDDISSAFFNVFAVNVEENSDREPIPYVLPNGIQREQNLNTQNVNALQNEQSLSVQVCGLEDGDARAIYKNLNLDIRRYKRIQMFVHAESLVDQLPVTDGQLTLFVRLGSDFTDNYYEYEYPLVITPPTATKNDNDLIWPLANDLDVKLDSFITLKLLRNDNQDNVTIPYSITDTKGNRMTIVGNPDLGVVKTVMIGIRNPKKNSPSAPADDDGLSKCAEIWVNELRLTGFDEKGGWAAVGRMETRLADLGTVSFSANMHTQGFGQIEQKVDQRFIDNFWQYDFATNLEFGKFFPQKWGVRIPFYASISQSFSTPQYDPFQYDVPLDIQLGLLNGSEKRDYRRQVQTRVTNKSYNFTNVRIIPQTDKKPRFYDIGNFNITYAYSELLKSDPLIEQDLIKRYRASFGYNFSPEEKFLYPFKKMIKSKSKYLNLIKDFNVNFIPSSLSVSTDLNRQFGEVILRPLGDDEFQIPATYNKYFTWDRKYGIKFNLTKSIALDFTAINNGRVDEPAGRLDTQAKRDSMWANFKKFGRTTKYTHSFSATYNLPLSKIPVLDWTQVRAGYASTYTWTAAPLVSDSLGNIVDNPFGNTIANSQDLRFNGEMNFKNLYDKWKVLKPYNSSRVKFDKKENRDKKRESNKKQIDKINEDIQRQHDALDKNKEKLKALKAIPKDSIPDKKDKIKQLKKERRAIKQRIKNLKNNKKRVQAPESPYASFLVRPLLSLKRISVNYTKTQATTLPGYMPKTRFFGQDKGFKTPGLNYAFGFQPGNDDLDRYAENGWISNDVGLNYQFQQTLSKNLNVKAVLEPLPDVRIDLTVTHNYSESYFEFFKVQTEGEFQRHLNPVKTGNFSISYMTIRTAFEKVADNGSTQTFSDFERYRAEISQRLGANNPNSNGVFVSPPTDTINPGETLATYTEGYGPYSQDVIIPAFIAAYTGKDPKDVKLNPLKMLPLPNWRLTYNGLSKIKALQKVFKSVTISHAYNSTFTLSSFQTNLDYTGDGYLLPSTIDSLTNNFNALYNVPQITISEQFAPLFGIDMTFANDISVKFDYKKSRQLSMGLINYQLTESRTSEFTIGMGYNITGLKLPIKRHGKKIVLQNELRFKVDVSFRDNVTLNHRLDQDITEPTSGMKTIRVSPSIDYVINKRLNIKIFFDRNRSIPATSASFPITNTKAGVTLRFSLIP